ncbi:MAG: DUF2975 domain-containing protein [Clostridiales bacterium]|nr:DUF2975 domain-containing protein [Clostridiales bacterium]
MSKRMNLVFTLLQIIAVVIAICGTLAAVYLGIIGVTGIILFLEMKDYGFLAYSVFALLTVVAMAVFSYGALFFFFTLCQRLKHATAFTPANEKGMHRIAVCCGLCGLILFQALAVTLLYGGFALFFLELLALLIAAYLAIGLVAYALELLLHRATAIQQENDLTI